jgi:hypothetical protein
MIEDTTNGVQFSRTNPISHILVCGSLEQGAEAWRGDFSS